MFDKVGVHNLGVILDARVVVGLTTGSINVHTTSRRVREGLDPLVDFSRLGCRSDGLACLTRVKTSCNCEVCLATRATLICFPSSDEVGPAAPPVAAPVCPRPVATLSHIVTAGVSSRRLWGAHVIGSSAS